MKKAMTCMLIAVSAFGLAGCQSIFGSGSGDSRAPLAFTAADRAEVIAIAQLGRGKEQLAYGNLAAAADAFQRAKRVPATMAEASNGLGVVYARLGRLDLAERNFRIAAAIDPANPRFAANIGRVERDVMLARLNGASGSGDHALAFAGRMGSEDESGLLIDSWTSFGALEREPLAAAAPVSTGPAWKAVAESADSRKARITRKRQAVVQITLPQADAVDAPRQSSERVRSVAQVSKASDRSPVVRIVLPRAKPLARDERITADGKLVRVDRKEVRIRTGGGSSS